MKFQLVAATAALAIAVDPAFGMRQFLEEIPNGASFQQALGHPDGDSTQYTPFANAFKEASLSWTAGFCKATFPGASMTNGEAFGDPCCTWKNGGKPDFTVTAFTTTPGKATVCATEGAGGATTPAPATGGSPETPATGGSPATPATGGSPATPATPAAPATPASPATGGSPATQNNYGPSPTPSTRCDSNRTLRR
ncbi:unnamed protein product [Phytophthora lilii]|uniref:Unnamed protein product n=1 Tax=Phytophthora lilii TaxID=2077276 RepID=A0A9W6TR52_9STRA|nr:unnamed protein product [Phytophthora lilii]